MKAGVYFIMKRLLFIYNPRAGKELLKPKLSDVIDIFVKAGYEVVVYPTQKYRDATIKIEEYHHKNEVLKIMANLFLRV